MKNDDYEWNKLRTRKSSNSINQNSTKELSEHIVKVITIISMQLSFTLLMILSVLLFDSFKQTLLYNSPILLIVSIIGSFGAIFYGLYAQYGMTETTLGVFTFFESLLISVYVSLFDETVILYSLITTTGLVAGLAMFPLNTKYNFVNSNIGGYLYTGLTTLCFIGFMNLLFRSEFLFRIDIYCGALLFMGYILYDVQLYFKNNDITKYKNVHVYAALNIYLDILNLFIRIVQIYDKLYKEKSKK